QACYSEYVQIGRILGHVGTTHVDGLAAGGVPIIFDDAEFPIHPTPDAGAVVACRTSSPDERLQASQRGCRERIHAAREISVERRWRNQSPFVCADGFGDVLNGQGISICWKRPLEQRSIASDPPEPLD